MQPAALISISLSLLLIGLSSATGLASSTIDYSNEPFVIEELVRQVEFQNDGTGIERTTARIRINNEGGVRALGQLVFGYASASDSVEIVYVRVRKGSGRVVNINPAAVQDLSSPVQRIAPVYTDFRQKHVTVPELSPGDTLEYKVTTRFVTPNIPGHFSFSHEFQKGLIVLSERLEIDLPRDRAIKRTAATTLAESVSERGNRRKYTWTSSNLDRSPKQRRPDEAWDVLVTSFSTWEEIGKWYSALERDRRALTSQIKAKASELVHGKRTDEEKLRAIYNFVSRSVRYVSLSFGTGRFQPHLAADVLRHQYGDCKDKHTLLAALAEAVGYQASTVLIAPGRKLDPEVPSPSQFNHVVSLVKTGKEEIWLDSTSGVVPFGFLPFDLRDKQVLVIPANGTPYLGHTPAVSSVRTHQEFEAEGEIDTKGNLMLDVRQVFRGDWEIPRRLGIRDARESDSRKWIEQYASRIVRGSEVSALKHSDPSETDLPLTVSYRLSAEGFVPLGRTERITVPLPEWGLPKPEKAEPAKFGAASTFVQRLTLRIPAQVETSTPLPVAAKRDFAEYSSSYSFDENTRSMVVERRLVIRNVEVPASKSADYATFYRVIASDYDQGLSINTSSLELETEGMNSKQFVGAGIAALRRRDFASAVAHFKRAVALEPDHATAWDLLGNAYGYAGDSESAISAFLKQIEVYPNHTEVNNDLGLLFRRLGRHDEAIQAYQNQLKLNPLDKTALRGVGMVLSEQRKYAEAVPALEKALALDPKNATLLAALGAAYLKIGKEEKGREHFSRSLELSPSAEVWNSYAYALSSHPGYLEEAQKYAESAVASQEAGLRNLTMDNLQHRSFGVVAALCSYWDTLGWVLHLRGETEKAERYLRGAWSTCQNGAIGDHLAQLLESRGNKDEAAQIYAASLATPWAPPETKGRLDRIAGASKSAVLVTAAKSALKKARTVRIPLKQAVDGQADFLVLLSSENPPEVKFASGDDRLREFGPAIQAADFQLVFPDKSATKVLHRGTLSCTKKDGCAFLLLLPSEVFSLN